MKTDVKTDIVTRITLSFTSTIIVDLRSRVRAAKPNQIIYLRTHLLNATIRKKGKKKMIKIIISTLLNMANVGDNNNSLGVQQILLSKLANMPELHTNIQEQSFNIDQETHIERHFSNNNILHIVIGAGSHNLAILDSIKKFNLTSNVVTIWSGHQLPKTFTEYASSLDIINIPKHIKAPQELLQNFNVITTMGVPHRLNKQELIEEFYECKNYIPLAEKYFTIVPPGDTESTDNTKKLISSSEALGYGHTLGTLAKKSGYFVLLASNRRISPEAFEHFLKGLKQAGLEEEKNYKYLDNIKIDEKNINPYKAMLGAALTTNGLVAIGLDSVSMVRETLDCIPNFYFYEVSSMNDEHKNFQKYLEDNFHIYVNQISQVSSNVKIPLAAEELANEIITYILQKGLMEQKHSIESPTPTPKNSSFITQTPTNVLR